MLPRTLPIRMCSFRVRLLLAAIAKSGPRRIGRWIVESHDRQFSFRNRGICGMSRRGLMGEMLRGCASPSRVGDLRGSGMDPRLLLTDASALECRAREGRANDAKSQRMPGRGIMQGGPTRRCNQPIAASTGWWIASQMHGKQRAARGISPLPLLVSLSTISRTIVPPERWDGFPRGSELRSAFR
jgi:hypothetical protein